MNSPHLFRILASSFLGLAVFFGVQSQLPGLTDETRFHKLGYIEPVYIMEADLRMEAKLDTGATSSSIRAEVLNAEELNMGDGTVIVEDGDDPPRPELGEIIRFRIFDDEQVSETVELPLSDVVKIKRKEGGYVYRPVVKMTFCIDGHPIRGEVNLAPRPNFDYAILVGRNMLKEGNILVGSFEESLSRNPVASCLP